MIARAHRFGNLVFDRDAIVRAALRAYVETMVARADPLQRLAFTPCLEAGWEGSFQRGGFYNGNGCGSYEVVAWTEAGVVGLAYELGFGPLEQLDLPLDAVTGGPDDVRGALPGLPAELEPALVTATDMLIVGPEHGERSAGVGFWLHGDRVAGTLFDDPTADGANRLAAWGMLQDGRLPPLCDPETVARWAEEHARRGAAPVQAIVDAVVARALARPTELTTEELKTLFPIAPDRARLAGAQKWLREVGVTLPDPPEQPRGRRE
jgi:hypothetical protein